jgi:cytochrome c-type biogenesis protein CcmF
MIGVISLFLGCICSFIALFSYCSHFSRESIQPKELQQRFHLGAFCYQLTVIFSIIAAVFFMYVILNDQFQYKYIWSYSSADLPIFYKIAVFWAGQEGSFLLWLLLHSLVGYVLQKKNLMPTPGFIAYIAIQAFLQILLLVKNPFILQSGAAGHGMGLNPLLQDFWMVIHPPIVFIGYALFAVPFAYAISGLIREKHKEWIDQALPWALAAWAFLGAGIFIGGYWAYKTLGWGGYWGWDPVENASLIPWLTGTALVHFLLVARHKAGTYRFAYFTAIYTFILVLYGTYLTRSGVLSDFSVHSFGRDSSAATLSLLISGLALASTLVLAIKWSTIFSGKIYKSFCSREFLLTAGGTALLGLTVLIFLGTSTPLFSQLLGQPQSISPDFYNHCTLPLTAVILFLAILGSQQKWDEQSFKAKKSQSIFFAVIVIGLVLAFKYTITNPLSILTICLSLGLFVSSLIRLCQKKYVTAAIGHLGLSMLCFGIILSSMSAEKTTIEIGPGQTIVVFGQNLRYDGSDTPQATQKRQLFSILPDKTQIAALTKCTADGHEAAHEPAIYRTISGDLYLSPIQRPAPEKQQMHLSIDQTQELAGQKYTLKSVHMDSSDPAALKFIAQISIQSNAGEKEYDLTMVHDNGSFQAAPVYTADDQELSLQALNKDKQDVSITVADRSQTDSPGLEIEASFKPMIFFVWLGCALITLGCFAACANRTLTFYRKKQK